MKLTELEPEWVCGGWAKGFRHTEDFAHAQGIMFACPHHFRKNNGLIGTHSILIWFADRNVPADCEPKHRWTVAGGSSFHDLTLTPSVNLQVGGDADEWHGFITNGEIVG